MAKNSTGITDQNGDNDDWIEVYNAGSSAVDLANYYFSDDPAQATLSQISSANSALTSVPPGGFLLFWADKDLLDGANHLDFKLSGNGESIFLYAPDGTTLVDQITFGPQNDDVSFGRSTDGANSLQVFPTATPEASNNNPPPPTYPALFTYQVNNSNDDAEELPSGTMKLNSGDLELTTDGSLQQTVGIRFNNIDIPQGAVVTNAYLQFHSFLTSSGPSNLQIQGELSSSPSTFISSSNNITTRALTSASIGWQASDWNQNNENGLDQRSPNLTAVIQEIMDNTSWTSGEPLAFIISGTGTRTAWSHDTGQDKAAQLIIELELPAPTQTVTGLYLNEIASRGTDFADEAGDFEDWVELYNGSNQAINIGGLYLTDNLSNPTKWQISSSYTIAANDYKIIWTDSDPEEGTFHTNFKLSGAGTTVALVQILNNTPVIIDSITIGDIPFKATYGRETDGNNNWVTFGEITPDATNNSAALWLAPPTFSLAGGIYSIAQSLTLSHSLPNTDIRYTTNGSEPNINSTLYTSAISIDANVAVKASAFKTGYSISPSALESYLINIPVNLPILHMTTEPDHFFSDQSGIYVVGTNGVSGFCSNELRNYAQDDWERPANLTMYKQDGTEAFNVNIGVKIGGACSRNFALKGLNIYFREKEYGDGNLNYPLFPGRDHDNYLRFKLRNSGQDFVRMGFRDGLMHTMLWDAVDLDLQAYRPAVLYINGAYWGIHNMRESLNDEYFETNHNIDNDELDLIKNPGLSWVEVKAGDQENYLNLFSFFENNDLSQTTNYDYAASQIDVNEFTNYWITMPYTSNYDWPANNVIVWRKREAGEKWRWAVLDTDGSTGNGLSNEGNYDFNTLAQITDPISQSWPNHQNSTLFFRKMLENTNFRNEYIQRSCSFMELVFPTERVTPMTDSIFNLILPESDAHLNRWGAGNAMGGNYWSWIGWVDDFKEFFVERPTYFRGFMQNEFALNGTYTLTMNYDANTDGDVFVNLNKMAVPYNYTGIYFKDIPLRITAIAKDGFIFSHWLETGDTNPETDFISNGDVSLTPIFVTDVDDFLVDLGSDTLICFGNSFLIDASIPECSDCNYLWENGSNQATRTVNPSTTTTYMVSVTNSSNETTTDEIIILVNPAFIANLSPSDVTCEGAEDGSVELLISGDAATYTFNWSNQEITQNISNLYPGNYTVTITDMVGCTTVENAFINEPPGLLFAQIHQTDASCYDSSDGVIDLVFGGGAEPYTFLWNTGATTEDLDNIPAGNYAVTITEANQCTTTNSFVIGGPTAFVTSFESTPILCNGFNNSFILLEVSGATAPFSYLWNTGTTSKDVYDLSAGTYEVSITDAQNCVHTESFTLTEPSILDPNPNIIPVSCEGVNNGAIEMNTVGGLPPYTFLWEDGSTNPNRYNLITGSYFLTITDANACSEIEFYQVTEIDGLFAVFDVDPISCNGQNDATLSVNVVGGTLPYSYIWNTGATSPDLDNLVPGIYEVSISDNGSCNSVQTIEITAIESLDASANTTLASCGESNGSIVLDVIGGTLPYDFLWSNGSTAANLNDLNTGDYFLTITDAHTCTFTLTQTIFGTASILLSGSTNPVTCQGGTDGQILLEVTGGNSDYTFNWSNGSNTQNLIDVAAGDYSVTTTDSDGCTAIFNDTVFETEEIIILNAAAEISCFGESDGAIDLEIISGANPFTFLWSNGATSEDIAGLNAGEYSVSTTDVNACLSVYNYILEEPGILELTVGITDPTGNEDNGNITVFPSGGTADYNYLWSNGSTVSMIGDLAPGIYSVTVTDANACSIAATYQVMTSNIRPIQNDFSLRVYPNPSDGFFVIQLITERAFEGHLSVYNTLGQSCFAQAIDGSKRDWEVDLTGIISGVYVMKIEILGEVVLRKIIVE